MVSSEQRREATSPQRSEWAKRRARWRVRSPPSRMAGGSQRISGSEAGASTRQEPTTEKPKSVHKKEKDERITHQIPGNPRASHKRSPASRNAHKGKNRKKPQAVAHSAASGNGIHNTEKKKKKTKLEKAGKRGEG